MPKPYPNYRIVFPYSVTDQHKAIGLKLIKIIVNSKLLDPKLGITIDKFIKVKRDMFLNPNKQRKVSIIFNKKNRHRFCIWRIILIMNRKESFQIQALILF